MSGRRANGWGVVFFIGLTAALPVRAAEPEGGDARLEHLLQAAAHLERAGQGELAARVAAELAAAPQADRQRLVAARREQIRQLEREIARLQGLPVADTTSGDQVVVELKLVALSWAKLRESGLGLVSLRSLVESPETTAIPDEQGQLTEFIELLCNQGLAQMLSRPRLATNLGQPATVEIGQDSQAVPAGSRASVRFDCTPRSIDGDRLRLDVRLRVQGVAEKRVPNDTSGGGPREIQTQLELRSSQAVILTGPRPAAGAEPESLLVLLTARFPGISDQAPPP